MDIAAYEAPRPIAPKRSTRTVTLKFNGRSANREKMVQIPADLLPPPDLITYQGHMFAKRSDDLYAEATVWPIIGDLDAYPR